jgi:predicted ATPase/DNA-binding CsgD family transcriptional regulator
MTRSRLPMVSDNHVFGLDRAEDQPVPVVVGTDAWYTWLMDQHIQSFSFKHPLGTFTARRERKRHGWYWYAYRKREGRLRKAYLGKTEKLTLERLNAVAVLIGQGNNDDGPQAHPDEPDNRAPRLSSGSVDGKVRLFLTPTSVFTYPTEPGQAIKHNLPAPLTSLIGRDQEVAAACALLRQPEVHLLTLSGMGGVGKTCLGLQIATDLVKDFADGVCFVSLAPISDPDLVIPTIAQTLGLKEPGDQSVIELLTTSLLEKDLLLFLDNFEQVIGAAPALAELLGRCLSLKILVTSREVLHVRAEQEFPVLPLALPNLSHLPEPESISQYAAVALFLQRAQSFTPDFQITTANARTIAEICTHLDGLPLALELAAARLKLLSPQALLVRLEHRFQVLTQGSRDSHTRQQTLHNTLQWSYDLLNAREQRLFRRLSVFVSGCTLQAVESMCATLDGGTATVSVLDGVSSLIDKSMLHSWQQEGEEPRLAMLETMREYGIECLTASCELEITRQSHALYYVMLAEEAEPNLQGTKQALWLARLEREHDNLRAALRCLLEQGEVGQSMALALRLGGALAQFWILHGHFSEGRTFLERALAGSQGVIASLHVKSLEAAMYLALNQGDFDSAKTLGEEGLALSRELGHTSGISSILSQLGFVFMVRGDLDAACSSSEEAVSLARAMGDKSLFANRLHELAFVRLERGEYARVCDMYEECLVIFRELGDKVGIAASLHQLALVLFLSLSDQERVHSLLEESFTLWKELGSQNGMAVWSYLAGQVALCEGDAAQARSLLEESVALYKEVGDRWHTARSLSALAKVEDVQSNYASARTLYEENLALCREMGDKNIAPALEGLASLAMGQGQLAWAAQLWGAAEKLRETLGAPLPPVESAAYVRSVAAARTHLGEQAFAAAWARGRTMTPEQALAVKDKGYLPQLLEVHPPQKPTTHPSPERLTTREMDVLRLLAQGLTSVQMAEQLVISLVTINTHVRSIYRKLGVSSRSAATRYAMDHHLL